MFRFTIRDVLWLTVVVGLGVSWWVDKKRIEKAIARLEKEARQQSEARDDEIAVLRELQATQAKEYSKLTGRELPNLLDQRQMQRTNLRQSAESGTAAPNP